MNSHGPCVLLVGASSEIGRAVIEALLAGPPGTAVLAGRPGPRRDAAAEHFTLAGHQVAVIDYDAGYGEQATAKVLNQAASVARHLDTVVIAVGSMGQATDAGSGTTVPSAAEPDLHNLLTVNLVGPALVANAAAELLSTQRHGAMVVITSAAAVRPRQEILGYAAAKQALDTLVRGLDRRTRHYGVRCMVVRPGRVRTAMTDGLPPVPLTTGPEHVAARVRAAMATSNTVVWSPRVMGPTTNILARIPTQALPKGLR